MIDSVQHRQAAAPPWRRFAGAAVAALSALAVLASATPAGAIRAGEPDTAHPSVGLVRFTRPADGPLNDRGWCTGTLIADRVVLTAAHCVIGPAERNTDFFVTFNPGLLNNPLVDPSVATEYLAGTGYADPRFDYNQLGGNNNHDRAVIVLEGSANAKWGIDPIPLPPLGFIDGANHGRARGATFTIVGYGVDRVQDGGPPTIVDNGERRVTTASLANTTPALFQLHSNPESANAEGGGYFGDSGSSAFWEPHPYALGTLSVGSLGIGSYARTDTAAARAFLDQFVSLP